MRRLGELPRTASVVLLVVAAGCAAPAEAPPGDGPPGHPDAFTWNDCEGFLVVQWHAPGSNPGRPPGDWGEAGAVPTRVGVYGWECTRVHWDHLERGPVRFLLEVHDDMNVPAACLAGAERSHWTLAGLWTDDPAVAAVAAAAGLPVRDAAIHHERGDLETWSWHGSTLTVPPGGDERVVLPPARFFWDDGQSVRLLDLEAEAHGSGLNGVATGTFVQPSLLSEGPQPRILTSSGYTSATLSGGLEAACA